jgi:hypothetical protein
MATAEGKNGVLFIDGCKAGQREVLSPSWEHRSYQALKMKATHAAPLAELQRAIQSNYEVEVYRPVQCLDVRFGKDGLLSNNISMVMTCDPAAHDRVRLVDFCGEPFITFGSLSWAELEWLAKDGRFIAFAKTARDHPHDISAVGIAADWLEERTDCVLVAAALRQHFGALQAAARRCFEHELA